MKEIWSNLSMSVTNVDHLSSFLPTPMFVKDVTIPNPTVLIPGFLTREMDLKQQMTCPGPDVIPFIVRVNVAQWMRSRTLASLPHLIFQFCCFFSLCSTVKPEARYNACFLRGHGDSVNWYLSSAQSLSCVWLFVMPWTAARWASLSITNSRCLLKLMSIALVMPTNHLILCHPLFFPPSIFPSIRVFSSVSVLHIRWPK